MPTWKERVDEARLIAPGTAPIYKSMDRTFHHLAEHLAPELFKWVGWSVAIAALRVVALRVDVPWLSVVTWILAWAVALRIGWFLWPDAKKHEELPDGALRLPLYPLWEIVARGVGTLIAFGIAWVVAFSLSGAIASSEMLDKVLPP